MYRKACGCWLVHFKDNMGRPLPEPLPKHECCTRCCFEHTPVIRSLAWKHA